MLKLRNGLTKRDMRKKNSKGTTKMRQILERVKETRLKWYGNVMLRDGECMDKKVMGIKMRLNPLDPTRCFYVHK